MCQRSEKYQSRKEGLNNPCHPQKWRIRLMKNTERDVLKADPLSENEDKDGKGERWCREALAVSAPPRLVSLKWHLASGLSCPAVTLLLPLLWVSPCPAVTAIPLLASGLFFDTLSNHQWSKFFLRYPIELISSLLLCTTQCVDQLTKHLNWERIPASLIATHLHIHWWDSYLLDIGHIRPGVM